MFVSFLIEVADSSGRDLASLQSFGDVLDSADRYTSQVHLDQCFFYGALTASISLDDSGFERDSFQLRDMERDVSRCCGKVAIIVTGTIALTIAATFVFLGIHEFIGLVIEQGIEGLLDTVALMSRVGD